MGSTSRLLPWWQELPAEPSRRNHPGTANQSMRAPQSHHPLPKGIPDACDRKELDWVKISNVQTTWVPPLKIVLLVVLVLVLDQKPSTTTRTRRTTTIFIER